MARVAKCVATEPFDGFAGYWEDEEGTRVLITGSKMKGPDGTLDLVAKGDGSLSVRAGSEVWDVTVGQDGKLVWSDSAVWVRIQPLAPAKARSAAAERKVAEEPPPRPAKEAPRAEPRPVPLPLSLRLPEPQGNMLDNVPTGDCPIWAIVGGEANGGIIVKMESDLSSQKLAYRLTTGARVEELDLEGDRLHYRRLRGDGPDFGWVSVRLNEKVLAVKVEEDLGQYRSTQQNDRLSLYVQSFKRCRPIGGSQDMRKTEELDASAEVNSLDTEYIPPFMTIRELTETDAQAGDVSTLALEEFGYDLVKGLDIARKEGALEGAVLLTGSLVVGFVMYGRINKDSDMYVHYIAVNSAYRRAGHGRCLLEHVRRLCLQRKVSHMSAECRFYNVEYYLGLGFTLNGTHGPSGDVLSHSGQTMQMQHLRYNTSRKFRSVRRKT